MSAPAARLSSPRFIRTTLPWIAGLVLVAGVIAFLIAYFGNTAHVQHAGFRPGKVQVPVKQRNVPLPSSAKTVAAKFVLAAAARKDLALAWTLAAPNSYVRPAGFTRKEWMTGAIPVQVVPAAAIKTVAYKVDESHPRDALMEVFIYTKPASGIDSLGFFIGLKKVGKRWLVSSWSPHTGQPVPAEGSNF